MLLSVSYSFVTTQSGFSAKNWGKKKKKKEVRHFRWIRYLQNKNTGNWQHEQGDPRITSIECFRDPYTFAEQHLSTGETKRNYGLQTIEKRVQHFQ